MSVVYQFQETVQVLLAGDDSWQSKNTPAGIILMDRHIYIALSRNRDHSFQEVFKIIPQILLCQAVILSNHCL